MVYRYRVQSTENPAARACSPMRRSCSSRHFSTSATACSAGSSSNRTPCFASRRRTSTCVASPAWSSPGTQRVAVPCIRCWRARTSITVSPSMWPSVSTPVTFGGGSTSENVDPRGDSGARKAALRSHAVCQRVSSSFGSNLVGSAGELTRCALRERRERRGRTGRAPRRRGAPCQPDRPRRWSRRAAGIRRGGDRPR